MTADAANVTALGNVPVRINLLGGFEAIVDGASVASTLSRRRHAAALVKVLALTPTRRMHREQLIDILWPETAVEEGAPRLHKAAHYARRALGDSSSVVLAGEAVALFPDADVTVDALVFQARAQAALTAGDADAAGSAADLYRGDLLPLDLYEPWAPDTRDRLHMIYLEVLRLAGRWDVLAAVDPADERAHLELISSSARRGDHRGALRQFERLERALRRELGVAPSPRAQKLRRQLLEAAEIPGARPSSTHELGVAPSAVGSHRGVPRGAVAVAAPQQFSAQDKTTVTRAPDFRGPVGAPDSELGPVPSPSTVGRASDRDRCERLLDSVGAGRGHALFVAGPAGVGKTALLAWLDHTATRRGLRVGTGVAAQIEGAWPYAPVLEALADLCRRHPSLVDGLDDALRWEIERGLSGGEISWTAQSGHQRLFVAAAELLRLAAAGSGAVLIIDDAHHSDDASLRLLHYLARSTVSERVLLVLAHRPQVTEGLARVRQSLLGRGTAMTLDLEPLSYAEVSALIRALAPAAGEDLVDAIWTASEGLPLSVIEMTRARTLSAALLLPPALTDRQRQAFAAAAVLGLTFDTDEFVVVTGLPEEEAYSVLDAGLSHRLLVRTDTGYQFRHSMLRDALLEKLFPSRFRSLQRQAATALEALHRSPARIGHHLMQAGDQAAAVPWMLRAAETSAALGAYPEALSTLEVVRKHAEGAELARLLVLRADLLLYGADAGAVDAYRDALGVATDPAARSQLQVRLARAATFAGDLETAAIAIDGLVTHGSSQDTELLLVQGTLAVLRGDLHTADMVTSEARQRVTLGRPDEWQTFHLITLQGLVAHNRGEWFQRLRRELRAGAQRPALAAGIFDSHLCVAEFLLYGPTPYPEVLELAGALRETAERAGVLRAVAFATALRGETALLMGDLALARTELQDAVDLHRDISSAAGEAHSLQRLAEVELADGRRIEANRLLHRALPIARFTSIAQHLLQRIYGTMITAAPDPAAARAIVEHAEGALGVADRCPFCVIMLAIPAALACADVGDLEDARRYLTTAEHSARRWEGTAWRASILEVKARLAEVGDDLPAARRLRRQAAELFDASGQPLDAQRCRSERPRSSSGTVVPVLGAVIKGK